MKPILAVCPACTVAVVGGLTLAEKLGLPEPIVGLWLGALIFSLFAWVLAKLNFWLQLLVALGLTYFTLLITKEQGWLNSISFTTALWGMGAFLGGVMIDKLSRRFNRGKILFPYQKVIFPVSLLLLGSIIVR